jgi:hypothetical protein
MAGRPRVRTPPVTHDPVWLVPSIRVRSSCVAHRIDCGGGPESSVVAFAGVRRHVRSARAEHRGPHAPGGPGPERQHPPHRGRPPRLRFRRMSRAPRICGHGDDAGQLAARSVRTTTHRAGVNCCSPARGEAAGEPSAHDDDRGTGHGRLPTGQRCVTSRGDHQREPPAPSTRAWSRPASGCRGACAASSGSRRPPSVPRCPAPMGATTRRRCTAG